jgi:methionyl-tRNA formyltransferase
LTALGGGELRIWRARPSPEEHVHAAGDAPGRVFAVRPEGALVATGDGALLVEEVQLPGNPAVAATDVLTSPGGMLGRR